MFWMFGGDDVASSHDGMHPAVVFGLFSVLS